jgi:hypothetical protein
MSTISDRAIAASTAPLPVVMTQQRSEIDHQISTARSYPRSIDRVVKNIIALATLDDETAAECMYAVPRDGKTITGPSARFAEIVASQWGNSRQASRVTRIDRVEKFVEAEGVFHDLETNSATVKSFRRKISGKSGNLFSDDMIATTSNAAASIALRNAILAGVPKAAWRRAYEQAQAAATGGVETMVSRRDTVLAAFQKLGVQADRVCAAIGVAGAADIGIDHITALRGMYATLKNGEATPEEMFPAPEKPEKTAAKKLPPSPPAPPAKGAVPAVATGDNDTMFPGDLPSVTEMIQEDPEQYFAHVVERLHDCRTATDVDAIVEDEQATMEQYPRAVRNRIQGAVEDKLASFG